MNRMGKYSVDQSIETDAGVMNDRNTLLPCIKRQRYLRMEECVSMQVIQPNDEEGI